MQTTTFCRGFVFRFLRNGHAPLALVSCLVFAVLVTPVRADQIGIGPTNSGVVLSWTNPAAILQGSSNLPGLWNQITGAVSPWIILPTNRTYFFRLLLPTNAPPPTYQFDYLYLPLQYNLDVGNPVSGGCDCTAPENPNTSPAVGNPQDNGMGSVYLQTGELVQRAVDLAIPGRGFDWRFERIYRSGMNYNGPLGFGWEFNYNRRLFVETNRDVLRMDGLGRADRYVWTGTNYQAPSGYYTLLTTNASGAFTERDRHGTQVFYGAADGAGIARMISMLDRNSNQMTFQYNAGGQLAKVIDTVNRTNVYSYDANGRLTNVMDFSGRSLKFGYDGSSNLVSVTSPIVIGTPTGNDFTNGKTILYTYTSGFSDPRFNHQLLSVTAPNEVAVSGPSRLIAQYDNSSNPTNAARIVSLQLGGANANGVAGGTIHYTYANLGTVPNTDFTTPIFQNTVNNRNGNVTQYHFNQLGNIVRSVQFTNGVRTDGPTAFTNTFAYNKDGEMLARTNSEGDSVTYAYNSSSPDRFQQGNLLGVVRLPGSRGGDQTSIGTSMAYETNFNFVTTNTDARGGKTIYSYDSRGNRIHITHRISSIVEDFTYNAYGQMTSHQLPDNGSTSRRLDTMGYDASGYLASSTVDAGGFNLGNTFQNDLVGNVTNAVDARGNNTVSIVNALNQTVRSISRSAPGGVRYTNDVYFDANNNVTNSTIQNIDETGTVVTNVPAFTTAMTYNILDDPVRTSQQVDSSHYITTTTAYDANQNRVLSASGEAVNGHQPNNVVQMLYDERDLVFKTTLAPGDSGESTTQIDYDRNGNTVRTLQGTEDTLGIRTNLVFYDGYNRRTNTTDALANMTITHYDPNGNATSSLTTGLTPAGTTGGLATNNYTYDAMDRMTTSDAAWFDAQTQTPINSGHAIVQTVYSANSQVLISYDANNNATTTTYDTANRVLTVTDAKTNSVTYIYDANNNMVTNIETELSDLDNSSQSFTNRSIYDNLDRLIATVDNIGNTNRVAYDSRNNRVLLTDARGNLTTNAYDGLNRLLKTIRRLTSTGDSKGTNTGTVTTYQQWDDNSRLTAQMDDNLRPTQYFYDALNRQISTLMADGTSSSVVFDVHGNVISSTDANQTMVTSQFDLLNRATKRVITPGPGVKSNTTVEGFAYDGLSRLYSATNDLSGVSRVYDSLGRVLGERQTLFGLPPPIAEKIVGSDYDTVGNQLTNRYPGTRVITRQFDSLTRPVRIKDDTNLIASYTYVGPSRVASRTNGNLTYTLYQYDAARRLTNITHFKPNNTAFETNSFGWDPDCNKTFRSSLRAGLTNNAIRFFTNDSVSRLFASVGTWATNFYLMDGVGNRCTVTNVLTTNTPACTYAANVVNEYTSTPFGLNSYDDDGNLLSTTGTSYTNVFEYDYRNLMVTAITRLTNSYTNSYVYDVLGRRVQKTTTNGTTRFLYDGWQELEEQDTNGLTQASYVYGNYIDEALTTQRAGTNNYYYHADDLYNVTALTDTSGNVVDRYDYDDYGLLLNPTTSQPFAGNPSAVGNPLFFNGRRYEPETKWYYFRTRFLDPLSGTFTTRDTIGVWGDRANLGNPVVFVAAAPTRTLDPFGEGKRRVKITFVFYDTDWQTGGASAGHHTGSAAMTLIDWVPVVDKSYTYTFTSLEGATKKFKEFNWNDDCLTELVVAGHGSSGGWGSRNGKNRAKDKKLFDEDKPWDKGNSLVDFVDAVKNSWCGEAEGGNKGVKLSLCDQAYEKKGKDFMTELAGRINAKVKGWDDWIEIWPTGEEWTASPNGTIEKTGDTHLLSAARRLKWGPRDYDPDRAKANREMVRSWWPW